MEWREIVGWSGWRRNGGTRVELYCQAYSKDGRFPDQTVCVECVWEFVCIRDMVWVVLLRSVGVLLVKPSKATTHLSSSFVVVVDCDGFNTILCTNHRAWNSLENRYRKQI